MLSLWFAGLLLLGSFLLGSFPTGLVFARARGVDLRKVGSGNIGATNVGRAMGRGWAITVLLLDAAKGLLPVLIARALGQSSWVVGLCGFAAIAGHSFSVFLGGRGGKGVATSLGAAVGLAPLPALGAFGVYALLFAIFRISSVGSLAAVVTFPILIWVIGPRDPALIAFGVATAALVILRHKDNLRRLIRREELKA
ncbi:MAG TPA: glycerol-3-phosphate 1-O-acyltransferase PlsY [Polyangia bacterium]